ncbi:Centrosomal protein [Amphibalanus amphitrite]|uniref:Centrosomal protein n=1 Tax=Amphibalanus amphitrite TaxID=1232801 RepID=A0A6A4WJV5_AMPAM|nr:Centrosomal protein [Amphibalanus amphitrite]
MYVSGCVSRLLEKERSEAELQCRLDQGRSELEAVRARLYSAETEAGAARRQRDALRAEQGRRMSCVRLAVQELRGCLSLPQRALQERLSETLADLLSRRRAMQLQLSAAQEARDAAEGERQGCRAQRELLDSALQQLKSGAPQLQEWLTRCQAAELELATMRPRCERLSAECALVRSQLDEQERRAADAESAVCRLTNRLELRQLEIQSACEQHAEALRGALTWLAGRRDVCELQSRLSDALQPVAAAAALLIVSADTLRLVCGLPAPGRPPSPAGTYSIPSPPAIDELPPAAGEVPSPSDEVPPAGAADGDRAALPSAAGSLRRLRLAEASVASLQQRLRQKEQSCDQFRRLLDETRQQAARQAEQHSQQLERSSQQLRQQLALVASLEAERSAQRPLSDSGGAEPAQLSRLNESAELVAEQERAIGALMERLRQSRQQEAACRERVARLESERRETAQLLQRTVSSLSEERSQLRAQLEQQRQQAAQAAEARQHAQTKLVSRLREILLRKEQQHHALARVLKDVKAELVQTVEEATRPAELVQTVEEAAGVDQQQLKGGPPTAGSSGRADTDGGLPALLASAQQQLDDTKSELNERTLRCHKLQAELHEADRRRRDECGRLQRQLETLKGRLEQPARSARAPGDPAKEELAKWDERKKWQRCTERLKARLREKEAESERHQLAAAGLKDTIHRLERERAVYETKIRTLTALVSEERYVALERDNLQLKEQLAQLRGSERADAGAELEQLRQRVNMLNGRLAAQRAAARQGKNAAANLTRFQKQLAELTARNEELERENGELKAELAELRRAAEESSAPPADGGGGSCSDRPAEREGAGPATDAGTVSILRRLVERLRADNLRLRRQLLRHTVTSTTEEQVELMRSELNCVVAERDRLAAQLQRLTAS